MAAMLDDQRYKGLALSAITDLESCTDDIYITIPYTQHFLMQFLE